MALTFLCDNVSADMSWTVICDVIAERITTHQPRLLSVEERCFCSSDSSVRENAETVTTSMDTLLYVIECQEGNHSRDCDCVMSGGLPWHGLLYETG